MEGGAERPQIDKAAADLVINLPDTLRQEEARAHEALRRQEGASLIGRFLFRRELKRDPKLKLFINHIKIKEHNKEAIRSAQQNEGNIVIY